MKKVTIFIIMVFFVITAQATQKYPFNVDLMSRIDSFISETHSTMLVICVQVVHVNGRDLLTMITQPKCTPNRSDGYFVYKSKIIEYFQADSVDRRPIIDITSLNKNYAHIKEHIDTLYYDCEPSLKTYFIIDNKKLITYTENAFGNVVK